MKLRDALSYIQKCTDVSAKTVYFSCAKCGTWIKLLGHKSWPELDSLKYPLKGEAYYYCRPCLQEVTEKMKKLKDDKK